MDLQIRSGAGHSEIALSVPIRTLNYFRSFILALFHAFYYFTLYLRTALKISRQRCCCLFPNILKQSLRFAVFEDIENFPPQYLEKNMTSILIILGDAYPEKFIYVYFYSLFKDNFFVYFLLYRHTIYTVMKRHITAQSSLTISIARVSSRIICRYN